jgi:hypothetical protein
MNMEEEKRGSINRREWLYRAGLIAGASQLSLPSAMAQAESPAAPKPLDFSQYEPKSMLHVREIFSD